MTGQENSKAGAAETVLIIGATSAIARAIARRYALGGARLYLMGRDREALDVLASDLRIRGATEVNCDFLDVNQFDGHRAAVKKAFEHYGRIDVALLCHGTLPEQPACEADFAIALREMETNGLSTLSLLTVLADCFERQQSGCIAAITSVAGDRGRQSNYVYGSAKSLVSRFLQGLRGRLFRSGVHVVDIRPGFIDTPMTAAFDKGVLWARPDEIAGPIIKGIRARRNTIYAPWFWRYIMLVIRSIPEPVFKRLKL